MKFFIKYFIKRKQRSKFFIPTTTNIFYPDVRLYKRQTGGRGIIFYKDGSKNNKPQLSLEVLHYQIMEKMWKEIPLSEAAFLFLNKI